MRHRFGSRFDRGVCGTGQLSLSGSRPTGRLQVAPATVMSDLALGMSVCDTSDRAPRRVRPNGNRVDDRSDHAAVDQIGNRLVHQAPLGLAVNGNEVLTPSLRAFRRTPTLIILGSTLSPADYPAPEPGDDPGGR